ncbi:MAG: hypothetical protein RBT68_11955, partial [Spirochaetia bacterium]|nr:hypothetical protein [Spirochaetia bacterium]
MPALRFFRSTLVTLSSLAFLASVMLLVSSAPMEPAAMEPAIPEPSPGELSGLQETVDELVAYEPPVGTLEAPLPALPLVPFSAGETSAERPAARSVLDENQILAFYGKPGASSMGILGEYTKEELAPFLLGYAQLYDDANGGMGVVPAFYIIYGTCWPDGEIGLLRKSVVEEYVQFAAERGWLVFLDHQIGKYDVEHALSSMLPFLHHPNVHLALDPEWRTLKPMQELGYVTGDELNVAQALMEAYLAEHELPGNRMLVVHQFTNSLIRQREAVETGFEKVTLVHTADGFGSPALKRYAY